MITGRAQHFPEDRRAEVTSISLECGRNTSQSGGDVAGDNKMRQPYSMCLARAGPLRLYP